MFTDRFIKLPIVVFSQKQQDLTGNAEDNPSWIKINPMEISNYKPSYDEGEPDIEIIHMILKNGFSTLVYLSPEEFEAALNEHQK